MKLCPYCKTERPLSEFKPGSHKCKVCVAADNAAYREANKEKLAADRAAYRAANKENIAAYLAAYREANKEKLAASTVARSAAWYVANKERKATAGAAWREANKEREADNTHQRNIVRRRTVAGQTPAWADRTAILAVYREAREFRAAGVPATVDHIVPLRGKLVSGLHCEANLTIKLASWNFGKCNRFDPATFNNAQPLEMAA